MSLKLLTEISLPSHKSNGGFDHAAYSKSQNCLYVAHTANDSVDIIDCSKDRYVESIDGFRGIAGTLVCNERDFVFTSNRGENSISFFKSQNPKEIYKISVGVRPNGLAFAPEQNLLLVANVGNPNDFHSYTLTVVSIQTREVVASIPVPGRTRWTVYDSKTSSFFVNVGSPSMILKISALNPFAIETKFEVPSQGPHGLDFDSQTNQLFCACDSGELVILDAQTGHIKKRISISGPPDVIFLNQNLGHLYIAIGDPGVIDVFDVNTMQIKETIKTENGAHTIGFDFERNKVYSFLPESCRTLVFKDV